MNTTLNKIISAVAVVALIIGVIAYNKTGSPSLGATGPQGPRGEQGPAGPQGPKGDTGSKGVTLGSVTGPDNYSPYQAINEVRSWYYSQQVFPTGSTTCIFLTPPATTTFAFISQHLSRVASSSIVEIGKGTAPMATTTLITRMDITTTGGAIVSTTTGSLTDGVLAPSVYVNFKLGGGSTAGTVTPAGTCKMILREV